MAKILTGPLAAGLSGKLGPVVFHQTRFGQVVQSKAKGRKYTTAPALQTKARFKEAASAAGQFGTSVGYAMQMAGASFNTNLQGLFIGRYLRWRNGEPWNVFHLNCEGSVTVTGHTSVGLKRKLTGQASFPTNPNQGFVFWFTLQDGRLLFSGSSLWFDGFPESGLSTRDVPEPFFAIVFTYAPLGLAPPAPLDYLGLLDAYGYNLP